MKELMSKYQTPLEKFSNMEFFLIRIQKNTDQNNSVFGHFSPSEMSSDSVNKFLFICSHPARMIC